MKYAVDVTQEDIDKGTRGNSFHCPVARAVSRTTGWHDVSVYGYIIRGSGGAINTPEEAYQFARNFDLRHIGQPFSFEFEWPDE